MIFPLHAAGLFRFCIITLTKEDFPHKLPFCATTAKKWPSLLYTIKLKLTVYLLVAYAVTLRVLNNSGKLFSVIIVTA